MSKSGVLSELAVIATEYEREQEMPPTGEDVDLESLSLSELERHRKSLAKQVQQATAIVKGKEEAAKLRGSTSDLDEEEVERQIVVTEKSVIQLRQDLHDAASLFSLKERILENIARSGAAHQLLFPLPAAAAGADNGEQTGAEEMALDADIEKLGTHADLFASPTARVLYGLVSEQAKLSSHLLKREKELWCLEKECSELNARRSAQLAYQRSLVTQWRAVCDVKVEAEKPSASEASTSDEEKKKLLEKWQRYRSRAQVLQHILQALILGSGLEWSELRKWESTLLDCGKPLEELGATSPPLS